ncbi:MAG TPA: LysM domain-containing protein [Desulfatiglandales bacterium]|nr:LysM domain-containing protein [Desulfatiglandales bacterium]
MEKIPYDLGYTRKSKNIRHRKAPRDPKRQRKFLILGGAGIIILIAVFAVSFRNGNRFSEDALNLIQVRFSGLQEKLNHIEAMKKRIALLEEQERGLQQSVSKLGRSGRSLRGGLDILTQKMDQLQRRIPSASTKNKTPNANRNKPAFYAKGRYHNVGSGDSLYRIAKMYGISVDELCRLNQITPNQVIRPGQKPLISPGIRQ